MSTIPHENLVRQVIRNETQKASSALASLIKPPGGDGDGVWFVGNAFRLHLNNFFRTDPGAILVGHADDGSDAKVIVAEKFEALSPKEKALSDSLFTLNQSDHIRCDLFGIVLDEDENDYTYCVINGDESEAHSFIIRCRPPSDWEGHFSVYIDAYTEFGDNYSTSYNVNVESGQSIADITTANGTDFFTFSGVDWTDFTITSVNHERVSRVSLGNSDATFEIDDARVIVLHPGCSGNGDVIYSDEAGIERFTTIANVSVPEEATSWDDCTAVDVRRTFVPVGFWNGGTVTNAVTFEGGFAVRSGGNAWYFQNSLYGSLLSMQTDYEGLDANDHIGIFDGFLGRNSRPTIDPSGIVDSDLQEVVNALIAFGIVIDGSV